MFMDLVVVLEGYPAIILGRAFRGERALSTLVRLQKDIRRYVRVVSPQNRGCGSKLINVAFGRHYSGKSDVTTYTSKQQV